MKKLLVFALLATVFASCSGVKKDALVNTSWSLVELNGEAVSRPELMNEESYTLTFEGDSTGVRVFGIGDGNSFFGNPQFGENNAELAFVNMGSTKMMSANQEREDMYFNALNGTKTFEISGTSLILKDGETVLAKFEKREKLAEKVMEPVQEEAVVDTTMVDSLAATTTEGTEVVAE